MEKKTILLAATTALVLAGCSDDLTENAVISPSTSEKPAAIMFGNAANPTTRAAEGDEAAALLGDKLYFFGTKTSGTDVKTIFDNYSLKYTSGSAGSTETNVAGWEYVGETSKKGALQAVKYWDYNAERYDFVAVTAASLPGTSDYIANTTDGMVLDVTTPSNLSKIYFADRVTATPVATDATASSPATVAYNSTVQFQFRRLGARMRIGFYETVPGYAIKNLVFYYVGAASGSKTLGVGGAFPKSGKYNLTYNDNTNEATVKFNGGSNVMGWSNTFGTLAYTSVSAAQAGYNDKFISANGEVVADEDKVFLGTTAKTATFAQEDNATNAYKAILPNENNTLKMQLRVDYTLVALDGSGDEINVRDAYVSVPVEFCKWKPNYAYTYLFKISDKSNGYTGKGGGGDQADPSEGDGRKPNPETGGDNNPKDYGTDSEVPPYVPQEGYTDPETGQELDPYIPDPDNPNGPKIPNPDVPLVPNPEYDGNPGSSKPDPAAPKGDQGDPSNPVPTPTVPVDPGQPSGPQKDDSTNPAGLFPITFDAVVVDEQEYTQETVTTVATPSITTTAAGSDVTNNNEYKVGENITLTVQDGVTPTAWAYYYSSNEVTEKQVATMDAAGKCTWESLGTAAKATLTPNATNGAGYYVVRVTTSTSAVGYKVIKVVAQ